jgi:hypothetical protein
VALKTKLHELVALSLLIIGREIVFLAAVGDGNDVGRLVDAALQRPLESAGIGVRVDGIESGIIAGLAECRVRAI